MSKGKKRVEQKTKKETKEEYTKSVKIKQSEIERESGITRKIGMHLMTTIIMAIIVVLLSIVLCTTDRLGYILYGMRIVLAISAISFLSFTIKTLVDFRLYQTIKKGRYSIQESEVVKIDYKRVIDEKSDISEMRLDLKCGSYLIEQDRMKEFKPGDKVILVLIPKRKYPLCIINEKDVDIQDEDE